MPHSIANFWQQPASEPTSLLRLGQQYFDWLLATGYAPKTIEDRQYHLRSFILWCEARAITVAPQVDKSVLKRYQAHLSRDTTLKTQRPGCVKYQALQLNTLVMFFRYLSEHEQIGGNPAGDLPMPKMPQRIVRHLLSYAVVKTVFARADGSSPVKIRDRAVLETLYTTGIRRGELQHLKLRDIDLERGTLLVRHGKGDKDRMVPLGDTAITWIERYLQEVRPHVSQETTATLFLNKDGQPLSRWAIAAIVSKYMRAAGLGDSGACHIFRHSMATAMLENGADLRHIQAILGHDRLATTQIYTKVSVRKLKEVHTKTHPAKMKPDTVPPNPANPGNPAE